MAQVANNVPSAIGIPGGAPLDQISTIGWLTQFATAVNGWIALAAGAVNYLLGNARVTTVAGLGTPTAGLRAFVTDATATTFASNVAGGSTNGVPVYADGTHWKIG
jgi:hypothetical protein